MEFNEKKIDRNYFFETNNNLYKIDIDKQNINWSSINHDRDRARRQRLSHHKGNRNNVESIICKQTREIFHQNKKTDIFFQFKNFIPNIPISIAHFQLRKNFKFLNEKELIYIRTFGIEIYNIITGKRKMIYTFSHNDNENESNNIICFDCYEFDDKSVILVCGRISSCFEVLYFSSLDDKNPTYDIKTIKCNEEEKQLVNNIRFYNQGNNILVSCNDGKIRTYDIKKLEVISTYVSLSCVNHSDINEKLIVAVGDYEDVTIFDKNSCEMIIKLKGHTDYGFACQFKDENKLATGNQDFMCKLWDIRKNDCYKTLFGHFESIGDLAFIENNNLIFAENMDFIHIYDLCNDTIQTLDYFGHSSGFTYHEKSNCIYQGIYENTNFGIMVYDKIKNNRLGFNNIFY